MDHAAEKEAINEDTKIVETASLPRLSIEQSQRFLWQSGALNSEGPTEPGYRLFWGREGEELAHVDVRAVEGEYTIVGRHTRCDAHLPRDGEVSLRHLLASAQRLDDGSVALRLLNLKAGLPFFLDDDTPHWSIVSVGPLVLRLGTYTLAALPWGGAALAPHNHVQELPHYEKSLRLASIPPPPGAREHTRITIAPPAYSFERVARCKDPIGKAVLQSDEASTSIGLGKAELSVGVLVGRSARCLGGGLAHVTPIYVSRAHLLLFYDGVQAFAYDLCSSNGTTKNGERIRSVLLQPGVKLGLGGGTSPISFLWT